VTDAKWTVIPSAERPVPSVIVVSLLSVPPMPAKRWPPVTVSEKTSAMNGAM